MKTLTTLLTLICSMLGISAGLSAPIHDAAAKGDKVKLAAMLTASPKLVKAADKEGATPLHYATASGSSGAVKLLLERNADVNARKKNGVTPLHIAAAMGHKELVGLLIASGAKSDAADLKGRTPLQLSLQNHHAGVVEMLKSYGSKAAIGDQRTSDISSRSLVTECDNAYWLTYPLSRLVINPQLFMNPPVPDGVCPSLPMNVGYYFHDYPVPMPWLWSWTPGTVDDLSTAVVPGPDVAFTPNQPPKWDARGINVEFVGETARLTVPRVPGGGTGGGALIGNVEVDLDDTPLLFMQVIPARGGGAAWVVKGLEAGQPDRNIIPDSQDPGGFFTNVARTMGWNGKKPFELRLFACGAPGAQVTYTGLRFMGIRGKIPSFVPTKMTWTPNHLITEAESKQPRMLVRTTTSFVDESTFSQLMEVLQSEPQTLILSGQFPGERIIWDDAQNILLLEGKGYHGAISVGKAARFLGVFPTWGDWLAGTAKPGAASGVWAVAFDNVKTGDRLMVTASLCPDNSSMIKASAAVSRYTSPQAFAQMSQQTEVRWDALLRQLPYPHNFQLHKVDPRGTDAASIRRTYYKAWAFLLSDTIPSTPENGFLYPQILCGKATMWRCGTPKALGSCQWESMIGMQFLALVDPETAWASFEGQMSAVDSDGVMGGECLPSRHAQTAWILYSLTGDKERLSRVYPAVKRLLIWKTAHALPDIAPARAYPDEKTIDHEWYVHSLMDATFAKRIATELSLADEQAYWQKLVERMSSLYPTWFWDSHGDYVERTDRIGGYCGPHYFLGVQGLILPPGILKERERESLIKLYHSLASKEAPFVVPGLGRHPNYHYAAVGLWQHGCVDEMVSLTEAALRDITSCGEFGENYQTKYPMKTEGLCPDVFGAALMIDAAFWRNGVILGDGLPIIAHVPNAVGVDNIKLLGAPISIRWNKSGDGVTLTGNGLKRLKLPTGFRTSNTRDGVCEWKGEIPIGKHVTLEAAAPVVN